MAAGAFGAARAEAAALGMLGWIVAQPDLMGQFMASSGTDPAGVRAASHQPEFLAFVVDFLLGDEAALIACCADLGYDPAQALALRAGLPGGDLPHWT